MNNAMTVDHGGQQVWHARAVTQGGILHMAQRITTSSVPNRPRTLYENGLWKLRRRRARGREFGADVFGQRMHLHPEDGGISKTLSIYGVHEPVATMLVRQVVREGMNVIDLGANIGYYALIESRLVGPQGRVVAIEPIPANVALLRRNVQANGRTNVQIVEGAAGDRAGTAQIHISQISNWHSMLNCAGEVGQIDVAVSTLDDVVERSGLGRVDFLRMDIEGYEVVAIKGMRRTLQEYHPILFIELHPKICGLEALAGFADELKTLGYHVAYAVDRLEDEPWRSWKPRVARRISFDELLDDERIAVERHPMLTFLAAS